MKPPYSLSNHKWLIATLSLLLVIIIATIVILSIQATKRTATVNAPVNTNQSQVVASFQQSFLANHSNYAVSNSTTPTSIRYQLQGKAFSVNVGSEANVVLTTKKIGITTDTSSAQEIASTTLHAKGFNEIDQTFSVTDGLSYKTYSNNDTVCQLLSIEGSSISSATQTLSCVKQTKIADEYTTVKDLIALNPSSVQLGNYTDASRTVITSGSKSLSLLTTTNQTASTQVAYVKTTGDWKYVAVLSSGNSDQSNGKYIPSDELTAAFKNPDYGDFLYQSIVGSAK